MPFSIDQFEVATVGPQHCSHLPVVDISADCGVRAVKGARPHVSAVPLFESVSENLYSCLS